MVSVRDTKGVDTREILSQYLDESLGYLMTNVAHQLSKYAIPLKLAEASSSIHLLSDYDNLG